MPVTADRSVPMAATRNRFTGVPAATFTGVAKVNVHVFVPVSNPGAAGVISVSVPAL